MTSTTSTSFPLVPPPRIRHTSTMTPDALHRVETFLAGQTDASTLQTPEELLAAARRWNYDRGNAGPRALLDHPLAEQAVARAVFWLTGSELLQDCDSVESAREEYGDAAAEAFAWCLEIEARIINEELPEGDLIFNPRDDDDTDWTWGFDPTTDFAYRVHPDMLWP